MNNIGWFTSGKYCGKNLDWVLERDPMYVRWAIETWNGAYLSKDVEKNIDILFTHFKYTEEFKNKILEKIKLYNQKMSEWREKRELQDKENKEKLLNIFEVDYEEDGIIRDENRILVGHITENDTTKYMTASEINKVLKEHCIQISYHDVGRLLNKYVGTLKVKEKTRDVICGIQLKIVK